MGSELNLDCMNHVFSCFSMPSSFQHIANNLHSVLHFGFKMVTSLDVYSCGGSFAIMNPNDGDTPPPAPEWWSNDWQEAFESFLNHMKGAKGKGKAKEDAAGSGRDGKGSGGGSVATAGGKGDGSGGGATAGGKGDGSGGGSAAIVGGNGDEYEDVVEEPIPYVMPAGPVKAASPPAAAAPKAAAVPCTTAKGPPPGIPKAFVAPQEAYGGKGGKGGSGSMTPPEPVAPPSKGGKGVKPVPLVVPRGSAATAARPKAVPMPPDPLQGRAS